MSLLVQRFLNSRGLCPVVFHRSFHLSHSTKIVRGTLMLLNIKTQGEKFTNKNLTFRKFSQQYKVKVLHFICRTTAKLALVHLISVHFACDGVNEPWILNIKNYDFTIFSFNVKFVYIKPAVTVCDMELFSILHVSYLLKI